MRCLTISFAFFISLQLHGQTASPGQQSPELEFLKILNFEKTSGRLSEFRSKVVILDFWATWCAPCIESFPHLESLQKKFEKDLKVFTITDESEERINKFLQKRALALPVILDSNRNLAAKFPHRSIPHAILIDKTGLVKAITNPKELSDEVMQRVLNGQEINIPEKRDNLKFDPSLPLSGNENFLYQVTITPYQDGLPSMANPTGGNGPYKDRRILCTNLSPKSLYEIAYQFPVGIRTIVEVKNKKEFDWSKQTAICLDLIVPEGKGEKRFEIMKQHLGFLYPFKIVIEKRQRKVKVLKTIDGQSHLIKSAAGGKREISYGGSGLSMKNAELKVIAEFLESQLNVPVIEEIGMSGLFNIELNWLNENPNQIYDELKKIGLELVEAQRDIDVLVIYDK